MSERMSWKKLIEDNAVTLDAGETLTVQTQNQNHYIGLRVAARARGYTATLRSGVTYVSKSSSNASTSGSVTRIKHLRVRKAPKWIAPQNPQEASIELGYAFYMLMKDGMPFENTVNKDFYSIMANRLHSAFWAYGASDDLDLSQPKSKTLREIYMKYFNADELENMLVEWFNAIIRLECSAYNSNTYLDTPIPEVDEEACFKLLEERYKGKLLLQYDSEQRALDHRRAKEAERETDKSLLAD